MNKFVVVTLILAALVAGTHSFLDELPDALFKKYAKLKVHLNYWQSL